MVLGKTLESPLDYKEMQGVQGTRMRWLDDITDSMDMGLGALEEEMAIHSHVLAWKIPGTGEPGGLPSMGSHRVRHD